MNVLKYELRLNEKKKKERTIQVRTIYCLPLATFQIEWLVTKIDNF